MLYHSPSIPCQAAKEQHAVIRLWNTSSWLEIACLAGHTLSVTQTCFSPSDRYLLSGSRDRQWCLYSQTANGYELHSKMPKAHDRIIWSVGWAHDEQFFATASRDKLVKVWAESAEGGWAHVSSLAKAKDSVTAVAWAPRLSSSGAYVLASGLDNGVIRLHGSVCPGVAKSWKLLRTLSPRWPTDTVTCVQWA